MLRLPDLDQAKSAVLNSLSSIDAQRGYRHAINEFIEWYCSEPRLSFSKTVVLRYRIHLESRHLAPGTVNPRLGAVRRLADEASAISSRIFAPLLSARGVLASLAGAGLAAFLPALASFFGAALALPPLAVFWPLGAPFFWAGTLLRGGLLRRNCRALFRNGGGGFGGGGFCVRHGGESLSALDWRMTIHHSGGPERQGKNGRRVHESGRPLAIRQAPMNDHRRLKGTLSPSGRRSAPSGDHFRQFLGVASSWPDN